jgi:hypothetical protein
VCPLLAPFDLLTWRGECWALRYVEQGKLTERLSLALEARHEAFHPQWGQLFKAGHQNSRWAEQVQDYACLYTSQVTNLLYVTPTTNFRTMTDLMPHDRACIEAAVAAEKASREIIDMEAHFSEE